MISVRDALSKAACPVLNVIHEMYTASKLPLDSSRRSQARSRIDFYLSNRLRGRLERREYCSTGLVSSSVAAFLSRGVAMPKRYMQMPLHTHYSNLLHKVWLGSGKWVWNGASLQGLNNRISVLTRLWGTPLPSFVALRFWLQCFTF